MILLPLIPTLFPYTTFFFNATATTEIYTLSLHDALPICQRTTPAHPRDRDPGRRRGAGGRDRKSTRLNSSHMSISYAVFCLKKKSRNAETDLVCRLLLEKKKKTT